MPATGFYLPLVDLKQLAMPEIIDATKKDIPLIQSLARKIWPAAFADILTPQQTDYMLAWMYSPASLEKQMEANHHFLLIKSTGIFCGYCSYEHKPDITKLHKIYLLSEVQGNGLGKLLLAEVIRRTRGKNKKVLQLNVNRYNKAVIFYKKSGFKIIREEDNDIGNGYFMNDYVMEMKL